MGDMANLGGQISNMGTNFGDALNNLGDAAQKSAQKTAANLGDSGTSPARRRGSRPNLNLASLEEGSPEVSAAGARIEEKRREEIE